MSNQNESNSKRMMHPQNRFNSRYDFKELVQVVPDLEAFLLKDKNGHTTIDFFEPMAVKWLNKALLKKHYKIDFWDLPEGNLCPGVPGRADYVHYLHDLLKEKDALHNDIILLDIGVGASCIYPIIAVHEFGWNCIGIDINNRSLKVAKHIVEFNPSLANKVIIRQQKQPKSIYVDVLRPNEYVDVTMCNPPFFSSESDARISQNRKLKHLKNNKSPQMRSNFGGKDHELWCEGGEIEFLENMIKQSVIIQDQVGWFTTLVSKGHYLKQLDYLLDHVNVSDRHIIDMAQGNKKSRILAWKF